MSLSAVASHSEDKGPSLFEQSCEDLDTDFFDQFLAFDPIDNGSSSYLALPESTHLANVRRASSIEPTPPSPLGVNPDIAHHHASASTSHFYSERSSRAAISDSELAGIEYISLGSPLSPLAPTIRANSLPSRIFTPTRTTATIAQRRARIVRPLPKVSKKAHSFEKSLRSPIRKSENPPSMVRCSEHFQNSLDLWGNLLNPKFQFDLENSAAPTTPPHTARFSDASDSSSSADSKNETIDDVFGFSDGLPQQFNVRHTEYDTPLATPVLDGQHSRKTSSHQPFSDGMGFPPTPQFPHSSGSWSSIPSSSEMNSFGTPAMHSPDIDTPVWWNHAATAPMAQPSPTALHINPRRATKSLAYQLQDDLSYESNGLSASKAPSGLMIQMSGAPAQQSFVVTSPHLHSPHMSQQGYFGHPQAHAPRHQYSPSPRAYVAVSTPHQQHSDNMHKSRSSTRYQSDSPSPKSTHSSFHIRKRRATKGVKEKKTPSAGPVDFVNFTPSDSRKILTGVAPSGSSKTRARREKEAMEKRRKLSMAALRAVRAAGGDVESLVEQGLFA
ncbi:Developmental regulatory wetA [Hyphodiscus hymeniophilus]|uniref:Developmental regulatory protein wetA n=1 Tax=Hyphodiscus hymeniophilus TaxID=353542 RepID=A0A9P7B163_9HELO|nr:Developmental regulatory wetA [Hyphodiscus hymeniophilus]